MRVVSIQLRQTQLHNTWRNTHLARLMFSVALGFLLNAMGPTNKAFFLLDFNQACRKSLLVILLKQRRWLARRSSAFVVIGLVLATRTQLQAAAVTLAMMVWRAFRALAAIFGDAGEMSEEWFFLIKTWNIMSKSLLLAIHSIIHAHEEHDVFMWYILTVQQPWSSYWMYAKVPSLLV